MGVFCVKESFYIEGLMPERALLKLRRAGIPVYDVRKTNEKTLYIRVEKRDAERVFSIYPTAQSAGAESSFRTRRAPKKGLARWASCLKKRIGLLLGGLLFIGASVFLDGFVFGVDFVGTDAYARETYAALREANIRTFAPYRGGQEDMICAKLLSIDGVEFCSVKKKGMRLVVEIRTAPFAKAEFQNGPLYSAHTGKILSITVLRGTALKGKDEFVAAGEPLVGDWFLTEDGGQVRVQALARVRMACVYEREISAESAEEAFAAAYLSIGVSDAVTLKNSEITATEKGFAVKLSYEVVQTINF